MHETRSVGRGSLDFARDDTSRQRFFFFAANPYTIRCGVLLRASASGGTSLVIVEPAPT